MDNIEFLRDGERSCRAYAANISPCADTGDKIKQSVIERADQFKACADEIERLRKGDD